ncbi:hypothetical protein QL285_055051 [Trifolium repens]|jgi:hypothetical protein|nr:hypothetical protein QL285_055051 [Trifolium repens]
MWYKTTVHNRVSPLRFLLVIKHPVPALMEVASFLLNTASWPLQGLEQRFLINQPEHRILLRNLQKIINLIKVSHLKFFYLPLHGESNGNPVFICYILPVS